MYAPGFKIYISTQKNGILDISDDVTGGTMVRRSSGVSSLSFTLQNARRKYDGVFIPNDRIIVMMKRLAWMRVFTGYLNAVPLVTAWPMAVQMTASCSLKRLQYYYWDPGLGVSQTLVANALANSGAHPDDGGTANAIIQLLQTVAQWPAANTHIAGIPQGWIKWAYKIAQDVQAQLAEADKLAQQFYAILGAGGTVAGQQQGGTVPSNALPAGTYGGQKLTDAQAKTAVLIYNAGASAGATKQDVAVALAVAMASSQLGAITQTSASGQVGLYQRTPSQGWGTAAQLADPTYQAGQFFTRLAKVTGRDKMTTGQIGRVVLNTSAGDAGAYQQMDAMGTAIVSKLAPGSTTPGGVSLAPVLQGASPSKAGRTSAVALLQTALELIQRHPAIPYQAGNDSPPNMADPVAFDSASFIQWAYFQTTGSLGACPRTVAAQSSWCRSSGTIIGSAQGLATRGALMFVGNPGSATHVEISLGDGLHTVGAHRAGTYAGVVGSAASSWTCAGIVPGLDYSGAVGAGPAAPLTTTKAPAAPAPSKFANPVGKGAVPARIDMGVDYTGTFDLYAIGDGTIVNVYNSGWPGGTFIGLHLAAVDRYWYYAENIAPAVSKGQSVKAGDLIGHAPGGYPFTELGWAAPPGTGGTMAASVGQQNQSGDPGAFSTAYGKAASDTIVALGGPAGILTPGGIKGTTPAGWDTVDGGPGAPGGAQAGGAAGGGLQHVNPMDVGVQLSTGKQQPWYDPNDPFDSLFGSSPWVPHYNIDVYGAEALTGPRALIADSPLLPYIKQLCGSCMRQFSSAPNGDFIAWFPDYYGIWGTAAVMQIEPIELRDFNVWWDDTNLVTHQFVVTPPAQNQLDLDTGTVSNIGPLNTVITSGVATIDIPSIMYALFGLEPSPAEAQKFIDYVYKRFGARPDFEQIIGPVGPQGEFFAALNLFMQSWAYQYNADIPITFMPELWPGMLVQIPSFGFQAYVTTVTHTWQMGPGGGYSTTVNIAAPARLPGNEGNSQSALIGMPLAGGLSGRPMARPVPPDTTPQSPLPGPVTTGPQNKGAAPGSSATFRL